ncbi:MAG: hypothetical protein IJI11_04450 [Mogibacterium sp.]|nr:hypothetical protein [Mogibacterium sp.]
MNNTIFNEIRNNTKGHDAVLSNVRALGLTDSARALHIVWMYPDVLNVFGGRGDLMALMRVSCSMGLPAEMKRLDSLSAEIPFDWADIIYFASGDLTCMEDILAALEDDRDSFRTFAEKGGMVAAVSSSGAILAKEFIKSDGTAVKGLGLLDMTMKERDKVHGDDLWFRTEDGMEVAGNQIQLLDVELGAGQQPLGSVIYGRGNNGDGREGARSGNVIYTGCVGPVMVRNPWFAARLLEDAAKAAGITPAGGSFELPDEEIEQELISSEEAREFIRSKIGGTR